MYDDELFIWDGCPYKQRETIFPEGIIIRKPPHRGFPTYQGENQSWISKAAIQNAILHNSDYLWLDYIYSFKIYKRKHLGVSIFKPLCNNSENL